MSAIPENTAELLLLLFLMITFLQSGLDKVLDWTGNLSWLRDHFAKTPLGRFVPALLFVLTCGELASGTLCAIGFVQLLTGGASTWAFTGAVASCLVLLMLFFGQRVAKDYDGARTIAIYFMPAVFLVFLLQ